MPNWRTYFILLMAGATLTLSGCARDKTPQFTSPLMTAVSPPATPTPNIPAPQSGKGTVVGIIYDRLEGNPFADRAIYLAQIGTLGSPTGGTTGFFAGLDTKSDPHAQTDGSGRFVIQNVTPGRYALAVWLPNFRQDLLYDATTRNVLTVELKPGEISNMGVVKILGVQ